MNSPRASCATFRVALMGLVLVFCNVACEPASIPTPVLNNDMLALEVADPRFKIFLGQGPSRPGLRTLRLRLEPKSGWHMTPEAPTRLELIAPKGVEFSAPRQSGDDAVQSSEEIIEFAIEYRLSDAHDRANPELSAASHLKFGVCRNDNPRCEIVGRETRNSPRRDLTCSFDPSQR